MRILLADDNASSRMLLQRMLERSGFEVVCAENGRDAVNILLAPGGPRLAILDWVMPMKDGPSVCREIRACPTNPYVYMIMLTSRESSQDVVSGLEAGADDYLTKPCNPQEIRARVRAGQRILELQDKLIFDAHHDSLTGLPNRAFFVEHLAKSVLKADHPSKYRFAVLFVDIDRFKLINDSFGHLSGDALMNGVAQRLLQAVRKEDETVGLRNSRRSDKRPIDVVARIGGDEFVVLLDGIDEIEDGIRVAERIQSALEPTFLINGTEIVVTASIGIAMNDTDTVVSATDMLQRADAAMYHAKISGKARYEVSGPIASSGGTKRFKLEKELRNALEKEEFVVYYQPIIALDDSRIRAFEALVRWNHPERGLVQPGDFIGAAEEAGLIAQIGLWVLREACQQMHKWNVEFAAEDPMTICVNVSPKQFEVPNLLQCVKQALDDSALEAHCLELEVTENLTTQDAVRASKALRDLNDLGVSLSLDDFGTGYSSLSYLHRLPIRTLKIDRSFVSEFEKRPESRGIVQTIIALGHNLGMKVIAEGVENEEQLKLLKRLKCDLVQGYLFSRPIDREGVTAMLSARARDGAVGPNGVAAEREVSAGPYSVCEY